MVQAKSNSSALKLGWIFAFLLLGEIFALPVVAVGDPVVAFRWAKGASAVRKEALYLSKVLDNGCCFGKEGEIARIIARRLATCPEDPTLVSALAATLGPISNAVVIQDPSLARRVFVDITLACLERRAYQWKVWSYFWRGPVDSLVFLDPNILSEMVPRLVASARGHPERIRQVLRWLSNLPGNISLPPLNAELIDIFINASGNDLYKLPQLFARFSGSGGTKALLRLAEKRDFAIPPESARWITSGNIRSDALVRLEGQKLSQEDLTRIKRLAIDSDPEVAKAAVHLIETIKKRAEQKGSLHVESKKLTDSNISTRSDSVVRKQLLASLVEGIRTGNIGPVEYLEGFAPLGYVTIRALVEAFLHDLNNLERAVKIVERAHSLASRRAAAGYVGGGVPEPSAEDVPWIARQIRRVANDTQRLRLMVRLLRIYSLGCDLRLQRLAWEIGITPLLLEVMKKPGGCEAVSPVVHALLGRVHPPRCD